MNYRLMRAITSIQNVQFSLFRGRFMGPPILRLTTTGRRSGLSRRVLLLYLDEGPRLIVIASAGGAPADPDWCKNLRAAPNAVVERGGQPAREYDAAELAGEDRDQTFARMCKLFSHFAAYQQQAGRPIPVVALSPRQ